MKIPMTKQQRRTYAKAKAANPSLTRLAFLQSEDGRKLRTPEQLETPTQAWDRVARENGVDPMTGDEKGKG